jgi:uncharacterized membrane protein (UPF0127 family)
MLLVTLINGCQSNSDSNRSSDSIEETNIPFRKDGTLTIARNGEVYATIAIEIAENDSTRTRGMMQRTSNPADSGMLFIFDYEEDRAFWMANTPLSLDLLFADADSTIVTIKKYMQPLSAQEVPSNGPARFVLEVIAGYSDTIGIIEGDKLSWARD